MTDMKNYVSNDSKTKHYSIIDTIRDGLGVLSIAIIGYFATVWLFAI